MTSSLFLAAAASVCLAAFVWFGLIAARAGRHAVLRRSRSSHVAAAEALLRFQGDRDADALGAAWDRVKPDALAAFLARALPMLSEADFESVCALLGRGRFEARVAAAFSGAGEGVRLLYCELLAETGGGEAFEALQRALADRSPAVRIAAAIGLAQRGAAPALDELLPALGEEAHRSSRMVLLFELLLPGEETAIVRTAADEAAAPRLRLSALGALELAGRGVHQRLLAALADDPQAPIAAEVARSLAAGGMPGGAAILARLLAHPAPEVRREAARAAGRDGPQLRRLLADRDPTVASAAARSIWMLNPGPALPAAQPPPPRLARHG
ncbi:MAG TPA: HEAT repeat domain-containing protein [Allosphingosinicella sp.]|jgi:HEAT repeat protein